MGPSRLGRGDAPSRQAQGELHAACRLRRQCHRDQRRQGWSSPAASAIRRSYYHHTGHPGGIQGPHGEVDPRGSFPRARGQRRLSSACCRGGPLFRKILGNLRVYPGSEHPHEAQQPEALDVRFPERQEPEALIMATLQSLSDLGQQDETPVEAPVHVQKLECPWPRLCPPASRKDAIARVWIKPGSGKISVNGRELEVYFARPVLRMIMNQPLQLNQPCRPVRHPGHGQGWRPLRPGRRRAPRSVQGADLLRARAARHPQEGRLPDARFAYRRSARSTAAPRPAVRSSSPSADFPARVAEAFLHANGSIGAAFGPPLCFARRVLIY